MDVICDYFLREIMSGKDNKKRWAKMLGITFEIEHDAWEYSPHGEVRLTINKISRHGELIKGNVINLIIFLCFFPATRSD